MYASSVIAKTKAALQGSEVEQKLSDLLFDENVQVISSFELNQIASLTYGELVCDTIFETLQSVLSKPVQYSPLTLQKALVLTHHVLIYGAERVIQSAVPLGRHVEELLNYNTILLAQQQQGAAAMIYRLKGGGVDKGGPVRDAAQQVQRLLSNHQLLVNERQQKADPNSLVPVGDDKIAFVTDDVRLFALKKRMEQQQMMETRSNLAKAEGAFGSGYNAKEGKQVVGAAHSLEEMIKTAEREKQKFSDDGTGQGYVAPTPELNFAIAHPPTTTSHASSSQPPASADLLSMNDPPQASSHAEADLLDFGSEPAASTSAGYATTTHDLLGTTTTTTTVSSQDVFATSSVTTPASAVDIFSPAPTTTVHSDTTADMLSTMAVASVPVPSLGEATAKKAIMGSGLMSGGATNEDPFAALASLNGSLSGPSLSMTTFGGAATNNRALNLNDGVQDSLSGLGLMPTASSSSSTPAINPSSINLSSLRVSAPMMIPTTSEDDGDDTDNGFVMGGTVGAGLNPIGQAPAAPPPPPPGGFG